MKSKSIDRVMIPVIVGVSIVVPLLVLVLMYLPERYEILPFNNFPLFHAILNFSTALLLTGGFIAIKNHKVLWHRNLMVSAFFLSAVFLVSYVLSKLSNDPVPYGGEGFMRYLYFFILLTHILLSAVIVPLVLFTIYRAVKGEIEKHRKIARYTYPVWMYVAVTGVLVYLFMAPYY